jgi:phenylacetate-CoA ligase
MKNDLLRFFYSGFFIKYNADYNNIKKKEDSNDFSDFQESRLEKLLSHSFLNVPYYNEVIKKTNFDTNNNLYLNRFPILNKDIIRTNFKKLQSNDLKKRNWFYNTSGGSTGEPLKIIQDDKNIKWGNIAHYYYCNDMLGLNEPKSRKIILWGSERDIFGKWISLKERIYRKLTRTVLLNSFIMNETNMEKYIHTINNYKPVYIRGYASSLYELSKFAEKKNIYLHSPQMIESTSENLRDEMREKIESIFGTKVYDFYGSREVSSMAGECEKGSLHIFTFKNFLEILDKNDKSVKKGKEGRVVVTDLSNYSMPLIRYEIGDLAVLGDNKCKCGSPLPTLKKVTGRITDHFVLKDGTTIPGEYFIHLIGVVCNKGIIKKFQVIQEDYNLIKIKVVFYSEINNSVKSEIETKIKLVMGNNCKIIWDQVDDIPKTNSGKYLFTKSSVIL